MSRAYTSPPRSGSSSVLRVAVTFRDRSGADGPVSRHRAGKSRRTGGERPTVSEADPATIKKVAARFRRAGFEVTSRGSATLSVRTNRKTFERTFGTKLEMIRLGQLDNARAQFDGFLFPAKDAPWAGNASLERLIDDAYIQWPHVYMNHRFAANAPSSAPTPRLMQATRAGWSGWARNSPTLRRE